MDSSVSARPISELTHVTLPDDYPERAAAILVDLYQRHGPIFRATTLADNDVIFLVGPEANRFVMTGNARKFSHRIGWGQIFGTIGLFGDGLLTMDGEEHDQHRRMMNPAFTISYMNRYLPIMNQVIRSRIATWAERGTVDLLSEARKITFDVACATLAGLEPGPETDRFRDLYFQLLNLGGDVADEADFNARLAVLTAELGELLLPKLQQRRQQPGDDVLGLLIQARDGAGRALSDEQLLAHVNILLVAGHETSTSLSAWLLYLLSQHADYRQRVLEEQARLLAPDQDPDLEAIKRMKVLENALSEAERLYPPVVNGPRGVLEDVIFNGYHIPAGSYVFYSIAATHMLPHIFTDPTRFDPDRFAAPREEHKKTAYSLVGFGGGPRICIGINFAQVEIKAMASQILRRYELEPLPGQALYQVYDGPTGGPPQGMLMQVSERVPTEVV